MRKVFPLSNASGVLDSYGFYCPGCKYYHSFDLRRWKFNGNLKNPTFSPSLLISASVPEKRCHLFVVDGKIKFLNDCFHSLAGKTVDMESVDEPDDDKVVGNDEDIQNMEQ